eukprot:scaffold7644_cov67-Phaeocystis_antarctica.AAC.1
MPAVPSNAASSAPPPSSAPRPNGLYDLGPALVVHRLRVVDAAAASGAAEHEHVRLGHRAEPCRGHPRLEQCARRCGNWSGARPKNCCSLVCVGCAQVKVEAVGRGLEGDAQLELTRHADAIRGNRGEPGKESRVEQPLARVAATLVFAVLASLLHDLHVGTAHGVDGSGTRGCAWRRAGDAGGVHEASHGDERLHVARASAVHTATCAKVIHKRLHRPTQAVRAEDPAETRGDTLLALEPAKEP